MPPFFAAIATFVAAAATAIGITSPLIIATSIAVTELAVGLFILNRAAALFRPKVPRPSIAVTANYSGSDQPKRAIYGFMRVGAMDLHPPWTSGPNGEDLHTGGVLAYHECDSFGDVYFDLTQIPTGNITSVTGVDADGKVTAGKYFVGAGAAWIRRYRGTASQAVDFILNTVFPSGWPASMMGHGVCYALVRRRFNAKIWDNIPQPTYEVFGARCYDSRLDSTNGGSGTQRYADPTTWTWSANPFLCALHYAFALSWGPLIPTAKIDWASFAAAADVCDVLVNIPGATTQKRYTFNGLVYASQGYEDVLNDFASAGMGRITFHDGKYFASAGFFDTPTATIEINDWVGALQVKFSDAKDNRWNAVTPIFTDKDGNYQRTPGYKRTNANYETAFNGEQLPRFYDCPGCTDKYEAQRKAEFINRAGQNATTMSGRLMPRKSGISLYDTVYANYPAFGFVLKTFRVVTCTELLDGSIQVVLREEQSADWADLAAVDYNVPSTVTVPTNVSSNPFGRTVFTTSEAVPDPEFIYPPGGSSISSLDFWNASPFGAGGVFSFQPTGGIVGGKLYVAVNSQALNHSHGICSIPFVGTRRAVVNQKFRVAARLRRLSAVSWDTSLGNSYYHRLYGALWNGVGLPFPLELGGGGRNIIFSGNSQFFNIFPHSFAVNSWIDVTGDVYLSVDGSGDINSYFYPVLALETHLGGRAGAFEYDYLNMDRL